MPYADFDLDQSSCYLMGVIAEGPAERRALRERLAGEHGVQTTMYPAVHRFTAYVEAYGDVSLSRTERVADGLFSIPLFPHITEEQQQQGYVLLCQARALSDVSVKICTDDELDPL